MKKILVIALALASVNALGSRARMTALGNAEHIIDAQTVYINPSDMFYVGGDYVDLESGVANTNTAGGNAEGSIVRSMGDAKFGLSLGHQSANASSYAGGLRAGLPAFTGLTNTNQQDPLELTYGMKTGDTSYAGTLVYSNYNNKVANEKETSTGLRFGMRTGAIDAALSLGLVNTVETPAIKYKGTLGLSAEVGYTMDTLYSFAKVVAVGFKTENATTGAELAKVDSTDIQLGAISSMKKDGNEFFYGARLVSTNAKNSVGDTKSTILNLPIFMGLEVDASSWLVLRGSLTQNLVLLDNSKTEAAGTTVTETSPGASSTVAALGAGMKFNKLHFDGTLSTGTTQKVNTTDLLGQVGLTYMF